MRVWISLQQLIWETEAALCCFLNVDEIDYPEHGLLTTLRRLLWMNLTWIAMLNPPC